MSTEWPLSRQARAVLNHPARNCSWTVVAAAVLVDAAVDPGNRIDVLHRAVPLVGARLGDDRWVAGAPAVPVRSDGDPLTDPRLTATFDLRSEAPLRVLEGARHGRRMLAVGVHHAAFDGLAAVAILRCLLGGDPPAPAGTVPPGEGGGSVFPLVRRLLLPADRVAGHPPAAVDTLAARETSFSGPDVTARLAAAAVGAIADHNRRHGRPWRRVGLSVAIGGPGKAGGGAGNVASYRRIDLPAGADVRAAATAALLVAAEPVEMSRAPRLPAAVTPLLERLSDSLLVSNVGRHDLPGATDLLLAPVAHGRSAVVIGAAAVRTPDGRTRTTVTLRSPRLSPDDAGRLLDETLDRFA